MIHIKIKNAGIRCTQLGVLLILLLTFFATKLIMKDHFMILYPTFYPSSFVQAFSCIAAGLVVGTLIALQSQIFTSSNCKFFK